MTKRLAIFLVALLALGFAVAGCGDDEESNTSGGGAATQTEESGGSTGGGDADTQPEPGNVGGASDAQVKQAVEQCKQSVGSAPQLSAEVKKDLEDICEQAASGDEDAVRKASRDVCRKVVEESAPAGAARDQALEACDAAVKSP